MTESIKSNAALLGAALLAIAPLLAASLLIAWFVNGGAGAI